MSLLEAALPNFRSAQSDIYLSRQSPWVSSFSCWLLVFSTPVIARQTSHRIAAGITLRREVSPLTGSLYYHTMSPESEVVSAYQAARRVQHDRGRAGYRSRRPEGGRRSRHCP